MASVPNITDDSLAILLTCQTEIDGGPHYPSLNPFGQPKSIF